MTAPLEFGYLHEVLKSKTLKEEHRTVGPILLLSKGNLSCGVFRGMYGTGFVDLPWDIIPVEEAQKQ